MTLSGLSIESLTLDPRFEPQQGNYTASITTNSADATSTITIKRRQRLDQSWCPTTVSVSGTANASVSELTGDGETLTGTITWGSGGTEDTEDGDEDVETIVGTAVITVITKITNPVYAQYKVTVTRTLALEEDEEAEEEPSNP